MAYDPWLKTLGEDIGKWSSPKPSSNHVDGAH